MVCASARILNSLRARLFVMRWHKSLYARIAAVYLVVLLLLAGIATWVALQQFEQFGRELEQRVNAPLASNLAMILGPALRVGADSPAAREVASHIAAINPSLGLFVVNDQGRVVASYEKNHCGEGSHIPLAPLEHFLTGKHAFPLMGDMPCNGRRTVFSASKVALGGDKGFLYVVLHGAPYLSAAAMLRESYIARSLALTAGAALVLAIVIGLLWFAFLTRRFRALTTVVDRFSAGDYERRFPAPGDDEIGRLGRAFNDMAGTIAAQVAALRETDEMRRALVANISHDFRTPLTSLRGYTERLLDGGDQLGREQRQEYLGIILSNSEQLGRLADQLSTLSRLDAEQTATQPQAFSLTELAQDILVKFQPEAQRLGVELSIAPPPPLPSAMADIGLVERSLANLIDNALRHTPQGGKVQVKLERRGDRLLISVCDSGSGIESDELPLVTQRFYRTRASRDQARQGSGLGLAIAAEIVARHGGRLQLKSRAGHGTIARFDLPTS